MAKFNWHDLSPQKRTEIMQELSAVISAAQGQQAMEKLLQSLLTPSEIIMIGRRILIAERLLQEQTYTEIREELKVGTSTMLGVHKWLDQVGQIKRLRPKQQNEKKPKRPKNIIRRTPTMPGTLEHSFQPILGRTSLIGLLVDGLLMLSDSPQPIKPKQKSKKP